MTIGAPCQFDDDNGVTHAALCTGVSKTDQNVINLTWRDVDGSTWVDESDVPRLTGTSTTLRGWRIV